LKNCVALISLFLLSFSAFAVDKASCKISEVKAAKVLTNLTSQINLMTGTEKQFDIDINEIRTGIYRGEKLVNIEKDTLLITIENTQFSNLVFNTFVTNRSKKTIYAASSLTTDGISGTKLMLMFARHRVFKSKTYRLDCELFY
jgi:hypothetical protein